MLASMLVRGRMRETLETLFSLCPWVANSLFSFRSHRVQYSTDPWSSCFSTILPCLSENAIRDRTKGGTATAIHLWRIVFEGRMIMYLIPFGTWVLHSYKDCMYWNCKCLTLVIEHYKHTIVIMMIFKFKIGTYVFATFLDSIFVWIRNCWPFRRASWGAFINFLSLLLLPKLSIMRKTENEGNETNYY